MDRHESESELSKKARGSGDGEVRLAANVKKVAEILLVFATMVEMRGRRKATSVEVEMMIEAQRKMVEICEEFGQKDVFENDVFGIIVDDLGLGRMKETKFAACCPKRMDDDKFDCGGDGGMVGDGGGKFEGGGWLFEGGDGILEGGGGGASRGVEGRLSMNSWLRPLPMRILSCLRQYIKAPMRNICNTLQTELFIALLCRRLVTKGRILGALSRRTT
ncbi:hypothetical protein Tco_0098636 [Tanacetum coccineum]